MKHVIVIETPDEATISVSRLETTLMDATEWALGEVPFFISTQFNQRSAIEAVYKMFPKEGV